MREHTVVIPDLAGHGDSEPRTGPIETAQVLAGVEAVVSTLSGGRNATIVGNSLGGWMAMLIAQRHPEWVERIVVVNGGAVKGSNESARILPTTRAEAREAMDQVRDPASPRVPDFVLDDVVREARRGSLARFAATAATMDEFTLDGRLKEVRVPVVLLWGESDRLMPLDYARRMLAEMPQATITTLPRCGHVPQVECPEALLAALAPILQVQP
jgi:3-oxoadipate enol-lactonase